MFEALMIVLFYLTPWVIFVKEAAKWDVGAQGYMTMGSLLSAIFVGAIPGINILLMFVALTHNGFFKKKLFVKGD